MKHKFSIITPAHKNTPYHKELYDSILAQTYTNWEWILWLNNDIKRDLLPKEFEDDDRVIIYETDNTSKNVGYHKHHAFHKGTGDVLVEVDSETGDVIVKTILNVKEEEEIEDPLSEISEEEAQKVNKDLRVGDFIETGFM